MFDRILSAEIRHQQRLARAAEDRELRHREVEALEKIAAARAGQQSKSGSHLRPGRDPS
jgi:hypothetical protein